MTFDVFSEISGNEREIENLAWEGEVFSYLGFEAWTFREKINRWAVYSYSCHIIMLMNEKLLSLLKSNFIMKDSESKGS